MTTQGSAVENNRIFKRFSRIGITISFIYIFLYILAFIISIGSIEESGLGSIYLILLNYPWIKLMYLTSVIDIIRPITLPVFVALFVCLGFINSILLYLLGSFIEKSSKK